MRKSLGVFCVAAAVACAAAAYLTRGSDVEHAIQTRWVGWPICAFVGLVLGLTLLLNARRGFGVVFLLAAATCALIAYANGGPAWGEHFDLNRCLRQGGLFTGLGAVVC